MSTLEHVFLTGHVISTTVTWTHQMATLYNISEHSLNHRRPSTTLEKVLLDAIFMILKCELFTHFGSWFETNSRHFGFSTRSLGHVMFSCSGSHIYIKKNVNRDTSCPRSTTSSCFLSSSREGKHHVIKRLSNIMYTTIFERSL